MTNALNFAEVEITLVSENKANKNFTGTDCFNRFSLVLGVLITFSFL